MAIRGGSPRAWVEHACSMHGEDAVVSSCAALLAGADPATVDLSLDNLGGAGGDRYVSGRPAAGYWPRVWAARALRYAWIEGSETGRDAVHALVIGLADDHWRVREMCAKVVALREVGEAATALVPLLDDDVPRVRAAAARALGLVGEHEHLDALTDASHDPDHSVAAAADAGLATLRRRIDLV